MTYKFVEHTADIKIAVNSKTLEDSFKQSALALKEIMLRGEKIKIKKLLKKRIKVSGKDNEALLYNFLEEFLYLLDAKDFVFSKIISLKIKDNGLVAELIGDKASKYKFSNEIKAITYNEMFVKLEKGRCKIQFVLDV